MGKQYQKFLGKNIDLSPFGIDRQGEAEVYFCTPKGASFIGMTGVDGIHYCFVRGYGEVVFAVSPMNGRGEHIHAAARDFNDFLRLLMTCGDESVIEQAWQWDKEQFERFLGEITWDESRKAAAGELAEKLKLTPMEKPWEYIRELQKDFDYSRIRYSDEEYEREEDEREIVLPEWTVYFDCDFCGAKRRKKSADELVINRSFEWDGAEWRVLSLYSCSEGLLIDLCEYADTDGGRLRPRIVLNGSETGWSRGRGASWKPVDENSDEADEQENDINSRCVQLHYGLETDRQWFVYRYAFPWMTKRKPNIKTLSLILHREPETIIGESFFAEVGGKITFTHPETLSKHTLTVTGYELKAADVAQAEQMSGYTLPNKHAVMEYTIEPPIDLDRKTFFVRDSSPSDAPIRNKPILQRSGVMTSVSVGIIGGADGPAVLMMGSGVRKDGCTAVSSMYFDMPEKIMWRMFFKVQRCHDITLQLIGQETK